MIDENIFGSIYWDTFNYLDLIPLILINLNY
jgi:hypothetical protein